MKRSRFSDVVLRARPFDARRFGLLQHRDDHDTTMPVALPITIYYLLSCGLDFYFFYLDVGR